MFMKAIVLAFLLALPVFAEDSYVPLSGNTRTHLSIVNASKTRATVTIEVLGGEAASYDVEAGESMQWSHDGIADGAVKIGSDARLRVTANAHCETCGVTRSLPVAGARDVYDEGVVSAARDDWKEALFAVNPHDLPAMLTFDDAAFEIPARGTRLIEVDRERAYVATEGVVVFRHTSNTRTGAALFARVTPTASPTLKRRAVRVRGGTPPPPPEPETIVLTPSKDNTLFEDGAGRFSNGRGVHLFTGATASLALRRALVAFNVGAQIPPGSQIRSVSLRMRISMTISPPQTASLHNVLADWGEGTSNAGSSRDGSGAPAAPGDATWLHRFFPDQLWAKIGGDFAPTADASAVDGGGSITWPTSPALVARLQSWVDQPATNFGWVVIGNEAAGTTAKRFDSREVGVAESRPALTVEFVRP